MKEAKTLLLIDDDESLLEMYQKKLSRKGFSVLTAASGTEGVAAAEQKHPHLILLDLMMPEMSGIGTLKRLKTSAAAKDIPVVILTNSGDATEDIDLAKQLGAKGYLLKFQTDTPTLLAKIQECIL